MQQDRVMTQEDMEKLNPCNSRSISTALEFIQNPVRMCEHVNTLIQKLNERIKIRKDDQKTKGKVEESWGAQDVICLKAARIYLNS